LPARWLALCPDLVKLKLRDLAEIAGAASVAPSRTLSKLTLPAASLGPLVDSGLLLRFPSLRS